MQVFENTKINDQWAHKTPQEAKKADLVIFFSSSMQARKENIYGELRQEFPDAIIVGCSTGGEIYDDDIHENSIVTQAITFKSGRVKLAKEYIETRGDSYKAGEKIATSLSTPDLRGIFVIADGLLVNGSQLVKGITSIIDQEVPITGGLAGDGDQFKETYVSANEEAKPKIALGIGFYGDAIKINHGSIGGWDAFGIERVATKTQENTLYELNGEPALDFYKKNLGAEVHNLPASAVLFPITVRHPEHKDHTIIRSVLYMNEEEKSISFVGDIPEGHIVQLMRGNMKNLIDGAKQAAEKAKQDNQMGDQIGFLISCIGRKLLMGQRASEEPEIIRDVFGDKAKLIGFYSYGEISPHDISNNCELHNQTMTITTITESA